MPVGSPPARRVATCSALRPAGLSSPQKASETGVRVALPAPAVGVVATSSLAAATGTGAAPLMATAPGKLLPATVVTGGAVVG